MKRIAKSRVRDSMRDLYWGVCMRSFAIPGPEKAPESLLFVCTGNICRSPFAEKLAARLAEQGHGRRLAISSAGVHVDRSLPSPETAVLAGKAFGVDLADHRSRPVSDFLVDRYDMIFGMEAGHVRALRDLFPEYREKFHLLPLFERSRGERGPYQRCNIEDPYGRPQDRFHECFQRIEQCLQGLFELLSEPGSSREAD